MTTEEMAAAMGYADPRLTQLPEDIMQPSQPEIVTEAPPVESAPQGESPYSGIQEEDLLAAFVPGYEPAAPPSPASPPAPAVTKEADRVSVGAKGFSPEKYQQIKRGPGGDRQRAFNVIDQEAQQTGQLFGGLVNQANDAEIAAAKETTLAEQADILAESAARGKKAEAYNKAALSEQEATAKAAALSAEARANYLAALEDFRSSKVNPNELFQSMSKGDQLGTLASVFVHDFLGAKGIRTSALDTLNKAIDRNIDAQIQNIKIKGEAAEGMKTLWEMQRAESASDAEARARVRTFMLQAAEDKILSELGATKSGLASAKGQAAIAKLQSERVRYQFEVFKYIDQNALAKKNQDQQWIAQEMQHSIAQANLSIARSREAREAAEAKARKDAAKMEGLIPDISPKGQGQYAWKFRDGISKEAKEEVHNKLLGTNKMSRNINDYKDLVRQSESIADVAARNRFKTTNAARMRSLQIAILNDEILRTTGKAATKEEAARIEEMVPLNTNWTRANVGSVVSGFEKRAYADLDDTMRLYADKLPDNHPARQIARPGHNAYQEEAIKANAEDKNEGRTDPLPADNATQGLQRKDSTKTAAPDTIDRAINEGAEPNSDWKSYNGPGKKQFESVNPAPKGVVVPDKAVPAYAVHLSTLKALAPTDERAREQLEMYAGVGESPSEDGSLVTNVGTMVLPDGTDANSPEGKAKRSYALHLYKLAQEAGVSP